jgi:hypothetical protein
MNLSPLPIQKFFGNDGRPLVGGLLFTYLSGTSTKVATYTDAGGLTPNTNPVVLDYRGECRLWIDPQQSYTFVLAPATDTDPPTNPIWTVNAITAGPAQQDNYGTDTGSVNAIALAIPQISSPVAFTRIVFKVANTNTGPVTITINGGTAKALKYQNTAAFAGGEILAAGIYEAVFDGTQWQLQGPAVAYWKAPAETIAAVTPADFKFSFGGVTIDASRYGLKTTASAATNSTAIQNCADAVYAAGGGTVFVPAGTFDIDTPPIIWEKVSIVGAGKNSTILRKTTATASTISDATSPFYGGGPVGFPVCVLHFVAKDGTGNWSYATCKDIQVIGNTSSPNTTSTIYGFFFRGMTGCEVINTAAQYVQVGYFWGSGSTITSDIAGNLAGNVQRGFYQNFMTSTDFRSNYANKFRYAGYFISWYYSDVFSNAADNVGAPWKVGTTEISLSYQGNSCRGGAFFGNGCETHNGSVFKFSNCLSVRFFSNLGLDITSDYTGGSDVCLWENDSNNSCVYEDNRVQTTSMTGTGARHFIYKITSELGNYVWQRDRFVANATDTTNTSTWANVSGTIDETSAVIVVPTTSFTPTVFGSSTAGTTTYTTQTGYYQRLANIVTFMLRVSWSNQTGTGNLVIGGLPITSANTDNNPVSVLSNNLTFSNQLAAIVAPNSKNIELYTQSTGGAASNVPVDTAATVWISGSYQV